MCIKWLIMIEIKKCFIYSALADQMTVTNYTKMNSMLSNCKAHGRLTECWNSNIGQHGTKSDCPMLVILCVIRDIDTHEHAPTRAHTNRTHLEGVQMPDADPMQHCQCRTKCFGRAPLFVWDVVIDISILQLRWLQVLLSVLSIFKVASTVYT